MPYLAGDILVRAEMSAVTGLPADTIVNSFAFRLADIPPSEAAIIDCMDSVDQFYNAVQASTGRVADWISSYVDRGATHRQVAYKIQAGALGSPIYERPWIGPSAPDLTKLPLPVEVAAVLSFHGDLSGVLEESGVTRPRARRRGRIYVGPLTSGAIDTTTPTALLDSGVRLTMQQAAVQMIDNDAAPWCVWSRANQELYRVTGGWTDNAPDTQRRRGPEASVRSTFGS